MERKKKPSNAFARECIAEALFLLMKQKPYQEITITDICARAGVARTTYYRNFSSKENVIEDTLHGVMDEYMSYMRGTPHNSRYTDYDSILAAFQALRQYSEWINRMIEANIATLLLKELIRFELEIEPLREGDYAERILREAYAGALYTVFVMWLKDGMDQPAETVARFFTDLVARGYFGT